MKKFPNFPEKLTLSAKFDKKWFCWDFETSDPLILWQLIKISVLFHKSTHQSLPIWLKWIFGKFLNFPEKLTLCAKFKQKWFCWEFEVLPPDFVTINQNFSPIPQIYTPSTTILTEKNFWKVSQFSRKTYIVCKIWTKMVLVRIWSVTPWLSDSQSKFHTYSTNLHLQHYHSDNKEFLENFSIFQKNLHYLPNRYKIDSQFHIQRVNRLQDYLSLFGNFTPIPQICTHRATNLAKNIFEQISQFSRKTYIVRKIWKKKWFCCYFEVLPPDFVTINQNFSSIPQIYTSINTNLTEKNFWKVSQFSRKTYIVCKIWTKLVLLGFWSLTPWVCDNQSKFQSYSTNLHAKRYHSD